MAKLIDFEGRNEVYLGGAENVNDAFAFRNRNCVVTCWEFSDAEIAEIVATKRVWQMQFLGGHLVPHYVSGERENMREMIADYGGAF